MPVAEKKVSRKLDVFSVARRLIKTGYEEIWFALKCNSAGINPLCTMERCLFQATKTDLAIQMLFPGKGKIHPRKRM